MANTLLTISMITREALRVLENNLTFTKYVRRDFDDSFGRAGAKIGTVLNIRKPARYSGRVGQGLSIEDATETQVPLTLSTQRGVDIAFTSQDLALSVDDFSDRFIRPAIANVGNNVDYDGLQQYVNVYNTVGTVGTTPNSLLTYLKAGQKLDEEACPRDNQRSLVISPAMQAVLVDALKGLFQSSTDIAEQYRSGNMGTAIGFKWSMDQNCPVHTSGTFTTASQCDDTAATSGVPASSISSDGGTAVVVKKGDVFRLGQTSGTAVYAVNPQSHKTTGSLRDFVATADVASSATPLIPFAPSQIIDGAFQSVNTSSVDNTTIDWIHPAAGAVTTYGMAFHKDAFALGCADLPLPGGVDMAARVSDKQLGLSIRLVRAYDINTDRFPTRIDILYGWATLYPELACRVVGS